MQKITLSLLSLFLLPSASFAKDAPNFIIIYMDDLGWHQTSVRMMESEPMSKHSFYKTPNVERLAEMGMRFSNGYAPTATCTGSRVSIQFGQTSARTQYRYVFDVYHEKQRPEGYAGQYSLADAVKTAGKNYVAAHFGKGMTEKLKLVNYDVTDEYEKYAPNGNLHGEKIDIPSRRDLPPNNPKRIYSLIDESMRFLKENAGKRPFFMMVSHYSVHVPHAASQKYVDKWQAKYDALEKPKDKEALRLFERECKPLYGAMLEETDQHVGILLDYLKQVDELDDTYFIFTSDNGSECIPITRENRRYNGPLQEGKYSCFEGGIRVPFVVSGPGIRGGSYCDVPVVQWDLLATLHDLSGNRTPLPGDIDGGSLRDVLFNGNKGKVRRGAPGIIHHFPSHYQVPVSAIRIGDYKFMRNMNTDEKKLFNVAEDYREEYDLAQKMPKKVASMDKILRNYIAEVDGGDVRDSYRAFYETMDDFEGRAEDAHKRKMKELDETRPSDYADQKAMIDQELELKKRSFNANRAITKRQETWPGWYDTARKTVEAEIGMTKGGKLIEKK
ncbi:MAG: sulfatase-like hydrolase/transferase [Verrucomicrobiota bacterium]|nr:sulfatase-like hydrolase/transferase [Verrucomicrobiota bacterium]